MKNKKIDINHYFNCTYKDISELTDSKFNNNPDERK